MACVVYIIIRGFNETIRFNVRLTNLRAFLVVSAEKHRLPSVVADSFAFLALCVPTLPVTAKNASLKILN